MEYLGFLFQNSILLKFRMIRIAAFTGGRDVPSARFRVRQYINMLRNEGIEVTEFSSLLGTYPPKRRILRPIWSVATLATRLPDVIRSHKYDMTILQREIFSTFLTLEPLTKRPRVLDVDDAIWLLRRGKFAARLAKECDVIICGNNFIADKFSQWNRNVTIINTAVDTDKFVPDQPTEEPIIGWIGTFGGFEYLYGIESALKDVLKTNMRAILRIVSDEPPHFKNIPKDRIEYIKWSPENEVRSIQGMAVGIMPLDDSLWSRGKCSYKMLTYMSCGIPVVVSPIGMNVEVLSKGNVGFGPISIDDWVNSLLYLLSNVKDRSEIGMNGRNVVINNYSKRVIIPKLAKTILRLNSGEYYSI